MSTPEPGSWQERQTEIMGTLALLSYLRRLPYFPPATLIDEKDKTLRMLNWIATSFVRQARGDAVAAAFSAVPGELTLYIASNRGRQEPEDLKNVTAFVATLRKAMCLTQDNEDTLDAEEHVAHHALSTSNARFAHKLAVTGKMIKEDIEIKDASGSTVTVNKLDSLVKRWYARTATPKEDRRLASVFRVALPTSSMSDPADILLCLFNEVYSCCDERDHVRRACLLAEMLARSKFVKSLSDHYSSCYDDLEWNWLRKLKRQLLHLARYTSDAQLIVEHGFPIFRKILGERLADFLAGGPGFTVVWVGDKPGVLPSDHGVQYHWPSPPQERLDQLLRAHPSDIEMPIDSDFVTDLDKVWQPSQPIILHLHCELQLIHYLHENTIFAVDHTIGVSKPPCFSCNAYRISHESDVPVFAIRHWLLPISSYKFQRTWLIPPTPAGTDAVGRIRAELKTVLDRLLSSKFLHSRPKDSECDVQ